MPIEEATVKAQQSEVAVGTTSAGEGAKKVSGRKRSRQTPGRHVQKGEVISPLAPLPLTELPPDFDFVAGMSDGEKTEYIKSVLVRSEDEAIAFIAPALRFCGTAGSVVEAYLPLILEVKKHLCQPGRPKVDPAKGERNRTWEEVCKENFHIGIRRMQQLLSGLKQPKFLGNGGTPNRRPPIDREDYERARQVAAPARTLAEAVVRQGLGSKFPEALEILRLAKVPLPEVQPAASRHGVNKEPDWKTILTELVTTLEHYGEKLPIPVFNQMRAVEKVLDIQPGQLPPMKPMAPAVNPYHVKKRTKGNIIDFAIFRAGDTSPYEVFDTESEAKAVCEGLNTSPVASIESGPVAAGMGTTPPQKNAAERRGRKAKKPIQAANPVSPEDEGEDMDLVKALGSTPSDTLPGHIPVNKGKIKSYGYDPRTGELQVMFKDGNLYLYGNVGTKDAFDFISNVPGMAKWVEKSKGRFVEPDHTKPGEPLKKAPYGIVDDEEIAAAEHDSNVAADEESN
jgi:hypothetical protein